MGVSIASSPPLPLDVSESRKNIFEVNINKSPNMTFCLIPPLTFSNFNLFRMTNHFSIDLCNDMRFWGGWFGTGRKTFWSLSFNHLLCELIIFLNFFLKFARVLYWIVKLSPAFREIQRSIYTNTCDGFSGLLLVNAKSDKISCAKGF